MDLIGYENSEGEAPGEGDDDQYSVADSAKSRVKAAKVKKKKKARSIIRVNLTACKYDVLRIVLKKLGWKEVGDEDDWQLYWTDTSVSLERVMKLSKIQKINHFAGMLEICRKKKLSNNVARMLKVSPAEYNFHPVTYNLPDQMEEFLDVFKTKKKKTYILKPDAGCQGKGIRLAQSSKDVHRALEELGTCSNVVAQKYLTKPFLIDGLKFDLRVYILIASCDPLRMYIFKEGLARFCTEKYEAPKAHNLATAYMHLTNYAVNKKNENFQFNTDEDASDEGSKWSFAALREWMEGEGHDFDKMWERIAGIAVKTAVSIQPLLRHNYRSVMGYENDGFSCFEILGLDVMLDSKLKPWLIECNHSPSFGVDTPLDLNIKEALIRETLELACMDVRAIKKQKKQDKKAAETRLYGRAKGPNNLRRAMAPEEVEEFRAAVLSKREEWEKEVLPKTGFSIIYPNPNAELQRTYEGLLEASAQLFERSATSRNNAAISAIASRKKLEAEEENLKGQHGKIQPSGTKAGSTAYRAASARAGTTSRRTSPSSAMAQAAGPATRASRHTSGAGGMPDEESPKRSAASEDFRTVFNALVASELGSGREAGRAVEGPGSAVNSLDLSDGDEAEELGEQSSAVYSPSLDHHWRWGASEHTACEVGGYRGPGGRSDEAASSSRATGSPPGRPRRMLSGRSRMPAADIYSEANQGLSYDRSSGTVAAGAQRAPSFRAGRRAEAIDGGRENAAASSALCSPSPGTSSNPPSPVPGAAPGQRPLSGHFPRRESSRVRAAGSLKANKDSMLKPNSIYNILTGPGTSGVADNPTQAAAPGCSTEPADDMLDDYMHSYAIRRLWSSSSKGSAAEGPSIQRMPAAGGETQKAGLPNRFTGLSIRGIRPG